MTFQVSEYKGRNFLDLNNDDNQFICPIYSKGSDRAWLKHFGLSNLMCAHITRLITNHAPTDEYQLRLFPKESFAYIYREYSIEIRRYILFDCVRYKKSWNCKRESLKGILVHFASRKVLYEERSLLLLFSLVSFSFSFLFFSFYK